MYIYCNGGKTNIESGDLFHAKGVADANACYSQADIYIIDEDDVSNSTVRRWRGCMEGIEDCEDPIPIGNSGFYEDWQDCTPREAATVAESPVFEEYADEEEVRAELRGFIAEEKEFAEEIGE